MNANTTLTHATRRSATRPAQPARFAVIDVVRGAVVRWWQIRRDERLLLGQPDHLLRDVGIARRDIRAVLRSGMPR